MLLEASGLTRSDRTLLGAPGRTTRSKDATKKSTCAQEPVHGDDDLPIVKRSRLELGPTGIQLLSVDVASEMQRAVPKGRNPTDHRPPRPTNRQDRPAGPTRRGVVPRLWRFFCEVLLQADDKPSIGIKELRHGRMPPEVPPRAVH